MIETERVYKGPIAYQIVSYLGVECNHRDNHGDDTAYSCCDGTISQNTLFKVLADKTALAIEELTFWGYIKTTWYLLYMTIFHKKPKGFVRNVFIIFSDSLPDDETVL